MGFRSAFLSHNSQARPARRPRATRTGPVPAARACPHKSGGPMIPKQAGRCHGGGGAIGAWRRGWSSADCADYAEGGVRAEMVSGAGARHPESEIPDLRGTGPEQGSRGRAGAIGDFELGFTAKDAADAKDQPVVGGGRKTGRGKGGGRVGTWAPGEDEKSKGRGRGTGAPPSARDLRLPPYGPANVGRELQQKPFEVLAALHVSCHAAEVFDALGRSGAHGWIRGAAGPSSRQRRTHAKARAGIRSP